MTTQSPIHKMSVGIKRFFFPASCQARDQLVHLETAAQALSDTATSFNTEIARLTGSDDPVTVLARKLTKSRRKRRAS